MFHQRNAFFLAIHGVMSSLYISILSTNGIFSNSYASLEYLNTFTVQQCFKTHSEINYFYDPFNLRKIENVAVFVSESVRHVPTDFERETDETSWNPNFISSWNATLSKRLKDLGKKNRLSLDLLFEFGFRKVIHRLQQRSSLNTAPKESRRIRHSDKT